MVFEPPYCGAREFSMCCLVTQLLTWEELYHLYNLRPCAQYPPRERFATPPEMTTVFVTIRPPVGPEMAPLDVLEPSPVFQL
jgi:hypothetical protein